MSRLLLLPVLLALACGAAAGEPLDFTLAGVDGHNHRLAEHRGRATLVVFVASFCSRCRAFVNALHDDDDRELWIVHLGDSETLYGRGVELVDDGGRLARRLDIGKLPAWLSIDAAGAIVARGSGRSALAAATRSSL